MRTLHIGLRVTDPPRSLAFYPALGYEVVGTVPETPIGQLTMLKLPGDELVERGTGVSHLVVRVESMADTLDILASDRIELVQWPAGHPDGMTAADWPGKED